MPKINIDSWLPYFRDRLDKSFSLVSDASNYVELRGTQHRNLKQERIYQINELAFLDMYLSWEDYLENTFVRFMCGAKTKNCYSPKLFVCPPTLEHALKYFMTPKGYVEWTSAQAVSERAELVFKDGEPYSSAFRPVINILNQMRIIRNAIAHRSGKALSDFEDLVTDEIGYKPKGIRPGGFLFKTERTSNTKYIQFYKDILEITAKNIVR
ncbi:MAG: hypothetical protein ABR936_02740 [Bacteroidota bacterium]